jgi:hypothetical protein
MHDDQFESIDVRKCLRAVNLLVTELEWQERNVSFDIYFDTSEIRDAALGAESFVTKTGHFEEARRRHSRALVQMLLSAGWLGPVRLLAPHQSELLTKITFDFASLTEGTFNAAVASVVASVKNANANADSTDLIDSARETSRVAIADFISLEAARCSWRRRLSNWRDRGVLAYDTIATDYAELLQSDDYILMERRLAAERPDMTINNVNDAAAIATVTAALRNYEAGHTKRIPLLYVGTTTIRRALGPELESKLTVNLEKDQKLSVIRDWTYFVVRGTFRPAPTALGEVTQMTLPELRHLRDQLRTVIAGQQRISSNVLVHLKLGEQEINEQVDTFMELCFYRNVWLPYKELSEVTAKEGVAERESDERVLKALNEIQTRFSATAEQYNLIGGFWAGVTGAVDQLTERTKNSPGLDYIRAFGAFRFSPSDAAADNARLFFTGMFGRPDSRRQELHDLLLAYLDLKKGLKAAGEERAEKAAIVLWTLKLDSTIVELFGGASGWLEVLYASAILRFGSDRDLDRVSRIIASMETELPRASPEAKLRVSVGIAYLSFHLALRRGFQPSWSPLSARSGLNGTQGLVEKAAKYACRAADDRNNDRSALHLYALNQSLYYLIASGRAEREDLITRADRLLPFKPHANAWDYRYDDTLARYYHYLAVTAITDERRLENADLAKQHIEAAISAAHGDSEVETFRSILGNFRERISPSRPPNPNAAAQS